MIVVSDTSSLTNLAAIKQFNLLSRLYEEVHISTGVWDELNEGEFGGLAVRKLPQLIGSVDMTCKMKHL